MHAKFEVALSKDDYVCGLAALTGELVKQDAAAPRRLYERLAAYVLLLLAIGYFFPQSLTGLFAMIVATAILEWLMARRWTRSVHGISYDPAIYPASFEFSDTAITEQSALRRREWPWAAVRRVHSRDDAVMLELVGWDMIVLPGRLWPTAEARGQFVDGVRGTIGRGDAAVTAAPAPSLETANWFTVAAIAAFVDVCLLVTFLLPSYTRRFGPLAEDVSFAGGMLIFLLVAGALGYIAYRAARAGLPRLHARSPLAANILAQILIWAFALWFGGSLLGLF